MTGPSDLSDEQLATMSEDELDAWFDARSIGPWEPNDLPPPPTRAMTSITVRMPRELLDELKAEAARHRQPYQRYMKDLLLLALRQVQAADRPVASPAPPAQVRLTDEQLQQLNEQGELTIQVHRASRRALRRRPRA